MANLTLPHQQAVFRHDFHTRKKEENESVSDYFRDLKRLADKAYSGQTPEAIRLVIKERFIAGLAVTNKGEPKFKLWKAAFTKAHESLETVVAATQAAEVAQRSLSVFPDVATNLNPNQSLAAF